MVLMRGHNIWFHYLLIIFDTPSYLELWYMMICLRWCSLFCIMHITIQSWKRSLYWCCKHMDTQIFSKSTFFLFCLHLQWLSTMKECTHLGASSCLSQKNLFWKCYVIHGSYKQVMEVVSLCKYGVKNWAAPKCLVKEADTSQYPWSRKYPKLTVRTAASINMMNSKVTDIKIFFWLYESVSVLMLGVFRSKYREIPAEKIHHTLIHRGPMSPIININILYTVDSRYLDFGYLEQPLISKKKSGPCLNREI